MLDFKPSSELTIGVEIELQLIDPMTFDLVDGILPLKNLCSDNPHIIPEYEQTTVEITSRICNNIREMEQDILSLAATIRRKCQGQHLLWVACPDKSIAGSREVALEQL